MPALTSILVSDLIGTSIPAIDANFTALNTAASVETSARTSADTSLSTSITTEASSRTAADASLTTALSAEVSLTASRDASLATAISSGDTSLTAALSTAISAEASTRSAADASLTTRFGTLGYFATGTDAANLTGQIALARFPASTGLQVLRANAANTALEFATISAGGGDMLKSDNLAGLTNLTTARTNLGLGTAAVAATTDFAPASLSSTVSTADASLTTRISTEETTRGSADSSLTTRISTEETARASADTSLTTAVSAKMANPMTTAGDMIVGGASGAPTRVAIGTNGYVWTSNGTTASWQVSASGFSNPMTTAGDLIIGGTGGAAQRLAAGTNGYVLTLSGGSPVWAAASGGGGTQGADSDITGATSTAYTWSGAQLKTAAQTWGWNVGGALSFSPTAFKVDFTSNIDNHQSSVANNATLSIWSGTVATGVGGAGWLKLSITNTTAAAQASAIIGSSLAGVTSVVSGNTYKCASRVFAPASMYSAGNPCALSIQLYSSAYTPSISFGILPATSATYFSATGASGISAISSIPFANNTAYLLEIKWTDSAVDCYVNGTLACSLTGSGVPARPGAQTPNVTLYRPAGASSPVATDAYCDFIIYECK